MSESKKSNGAKNEEVVDKLVEDFKCKLEEHKCENEQKEGGASGVENIVENEEEIRAQVRADDYIDEVELKDKESTYTEEDRQRYKEKADNLKIKGNEQFKSTDYKDSAETYTLALKTCPLEFTKERAILYANRAAAKMKLELNESALEDCTKAIELDEKYLKALVRRAQLHQQLEKLDEALEDWKKVLTLDPGHREASVAIRTLPGLIAERNEKLKTEMIGKLKDLGNLILRPFGLSTNNFEMVQDPNTGGYNLSYKS